jgi:hypothetical protein
MAKAQTKHVPVWCLQLNCQWWKLNRFKKAGYLYRLISIMKEARKEFKVITLTKWFEIVSHKTINLK